MQAHACSAMSHERPTSETSGQTYTSFEYSYTVQIVSRILPSCTSRLVLTSWRPGISSCSSHFEPKPPPGACSCTSSADLTMKMSCPCSPIAAFSRQGYTAFSGEFQWRGRWSLSPSFAAYSASVPLFESRAIVSTSHVSSFHPFARSCGASRATCSAISSRTGSSQHGHGASGSDDSSTSIRPRPSRAVSLARPHGSVLRALQLSWRTSGCQPFDGTNSNRG